MSGDRFDDSPGLFGAGVGSSTCGEFCCGVCGETYNDGCSEEADGGQWIRTERFAGLDVCEDCFVKIERSVLARLRDILPWVSKILFEKQAELGQLTKFLRQAEVAARNIDWEA